VAQIVAVLEEFMAMFRTVAMRYQPFAPDTEQNPHFNPTEFERWATLARDTARMLAPYQTPQLKTVGVNVDLVRAGHIDDDEPITYPTVAQIRRELALRGLPPFKDVIEAEIIVDQEEE
jgi:hypothetical protein